MQFFLTDCGLPAGVLKYTMEKYTHEEQKVLDESRAKSDSEAVLDGASIFYREHDPITGQALEKPEKIIAFTEDQQEAARDEMVAENLTKRKQGRIDILGQEKEIELFVESKIKSPMEMSYDDQENVIHYLTKKPELISKFKKPILDSLPLWTQFHREPLMWAVLVNDGVAGAIVKEIRALSLLKAGDPGRQKHEEAMKAVIEETYADQSEIARKTLLKFVPQSGMLPV